MNELFEKAKSDRRYYEKFIDALAYQYHANRENSNKLYVNYVKAHVAKLREKIFWPKDQSTNNSFALEVITSQTFEELKKEHNYKKFVGYYEVQVKDSVP